MANSHESRDAVDISNSRSIALLTSQLFSSLGVRGVARLAEATFSDQPIVLYDVNGEPLFHDYALVSGGATVGTIRTAANRKLGSPVISIHHTPPGWSPASALRLARESLHATESNAVIEAWQLVVYAYPKIGIRLNYKVSGKNATQTQIFDASSGNPVSNSTDPDHQFSQYSFLDSLETGDVRARRERYEDAEKKIQELKASQPALFEGALSKTQLATALPQLSSLGTQSGTVRLSPYCPNSPIGLTHYAQILDYFCVDASAQMLMEHYGWNYTQNQIAVAMGTTAAAGGTTGAGLTTGFASLTNNSLPLTFDNGATRAQQFQDAITEVSANRPLFTQVPHHYRVCVGFFENTIQILWFTLGLNQMLYIYDPWPWNPDLCQGGAIYWESWATSPVMWFGIVHHA
jgi:hypothetical protein